MTLVFKFAYNMTMGKSTNVTIILHWLCIGRSHCGNPGRDDSGMNEQHSPRASSSQQRVTSG